jgi:hypothetical protein
MPAVEAKRPWWKIKRVLGVTTAIVGGALALCPGVGTLFMIGTLPVTAPALGYVITQIGGLLFAYGAGAKSERDKQAAEEEKK